MNLTLPIIFVAFLQLLGFCLGIQFPKFAAEVHRPYISEVIVVTRLHMLYKVACFKKGISTVHNKLSLLCMCLFYWTDYGQ